jgi:hypothetical protein
MRQSSTEFGQLLFKAGRGVGLPLGIAEDLVAPIFWLQTCGFPGDSEALNALTALDEGRAAHEFPDLFSLSNDVERASGTLSGIYLAAVGCDSLQLGWPRQDKEIHFLNVDSPLLFSAALILAHRRVKTDLALNIETETYVLSGARNGETLWRQKEPRKQSGGAQGAAGIRLWASNDAVDHTSGTLLLDGAREAQLHQICEAEGLCANPDSIRGLKTLADRLLVPESERSLKFGAGAGLVDSD